ncbi:MAG: alpha/beta fold hydrolase [Parvibaculales bacterium]
MSEFQTQHLNANGVRLCYARLHPNEQTQDAPIIFIRGLGTQLIQWPPAFLTFFTAAGYEVIIFDNRDVGESQKLDAAGVPDIMALLAGREAGASFPVPYAIADIAADVIGLMDGLEIEKAHIFGMSLGGMVAQHLAFSHAARIGKVMCVMSTSGHPDLPMPAASELAPPDDADDSEALIAYLTEMLGEHMSPAFPTPVEARQAMAAKLAARHYHPPGVVRQMAAAIADGDRTDRLKTVRLPFMVLHGEADTLIDVACGKHIADTVPGAVWRPVAGMGHDIGPGLEDEIGTDILSFLAG